MDLSVYMPLQYTTTEEADYCLFMYETYIKLYEDGNYHFSYLAAHVLMMYQIYLRLWQLSKTDPGRVTDALVLAHYDSNDGKPYGSSLKEIVENARSPMVFNIFKIDERVLVKILTLLECNDPRPFKYAIDFRNKLAHASGSLMFEDELMYEEKILNLNNLMKIIHSASANELASYVLDTIKDRQYVKPYIVGEIEVDIEQLIVSPLMLSSYDCYLIKDYLGTTRLGTIIANYFENKTNEVVFA